MESKSISYNNRIISYKLGGKGDAVVLLHGFGEDSNIWQELAEALKKNYMVITPDIPGSGASDLTDDVSMEGIAQVVKSITEAEELDQFVLIGHSMGGYITMAFAEKYPQLLKGFGLFHSTAMPDTEEKKATRQKGISFIRQHGTKAFLDTIIPNLFSNGVKEQKPELIQTFSNSFPEFSKPALIDYYEAMINRPDRTSVLKEAKVPVLFIFGTEDIVIPLDDGLKLTTLPAMSNVHILKESGHMGMLEEPIASREAVEDFLHQVAIFNNNF